MTIVQCDNQAYTMSCTGMSKSRTRPTAALELVRKATVVGLLSAFHACAAPQLPVMEQSSGNWKQEPPPSSLPPSSPPPLSPSSPTNFTIVTAMFDIGRGHWDSAFRRPYAQYLAFMKLVLQLDANILAFTDHVAAKFILRMRNTPRFAHKTHVVEMRVEDLPYFRHRGRIREIMENETYRKLNPQAVLGHPEANMPEYDIVMLSKTHLVERASRADPFNSSYWMWLDGGYGHGQAAVFPRDGQWSPQNLFEHEDKVTVVELGPPGTAEALRTNRHRLHKMRGAAISGGFFGGGKRALRRLQALEQAVVAEWLEHGIVDDDQSCRLLAYYRQPSLFRLVQGRWFDAFTLFTHHTSRPLV